MTERESQLMDMLRRMCEAMRCEDCPLLTDGSCELAAKLMLKEALNERA